MHISSAAIVGGCIFFFFFSILPSSSAGSGIRKATGAKFTSVIRHASAPILKLEHKGPVRELEHLEGEYKHFYDSMLLPLVEKCPENGPWDSIFDVMDRFSRKGEEKLCQNVIGLNDLFTKLDKHNQTSKKGNILRNMFSDKHENDDNIPQQIHNHIRDHNENVLIEDCKSAKLVGTTSQIKPTRWNLNAAFKDKFGQLIGELKKEENTDKKSSRKIAYELLEIGNKMNQYFMRTEEERMEWAFQLFAAQLAVYSLRLDQHPISAPHEKFAIHAIVQSWAIGMEPRLTDLGEYTTHFYDSMLVPLIMECPPNGYPGDSSFDVADRFSLDGGTKLCQNVIGLNDLFTKMDKQKQKQKQNQKQNQMSKKWKLKKLADKHEKNIPQQILDHIRDHNENLLKIVAMDWIPVQIQEIKHEVWKIKSERWDLNEALKTKFGELIKELENEKNAGEHIEEASREIAYQLLCIADKMVEYFKTSEREQMELAFQLFAAQLAVYSLRLDKLPTSANKKGAIQAIAQSWPIGMNIYMKIVGGNEPTVKA